MQTFSEAISIVLLGANVIQLITYFFTRSATKVRMQASFNVWYRVAQTADEIAAHPEKAAQLVGVITGFADGARSEIKAYSQQSLGFVPWIEHPSQGSSNPPVSSTPSLWQRIKSVFIP
jgi:hypothetical protein